MTLPDEPERRGKARRADPRPRQTPQRRRCRARSRRPARADETRSSRRCEREAGSSRERGRAERGASCRAAGGQHQRNPRRRVPDAITAAYMVPDMHGESVAVEVSRDSLTAVMTAARDDARLDLAYLRCLSGVDWQDEGLEVVYHLWSFTKCPRTHGQDARHLRRPASYPASPTIYPRRRLARARDARHVRHQLRRAPEPRAAAAARRHDRPLPAAQGQPAAGDRGVAGRQTCRDGAGGRASE